MRSNDSRDEIQFETLCRERGRAHVCVPSKVVKLIRE